MCALGRDRKPPTLALAPSQWGKCMMTLWHNYKAKANTKAHAQEHHVSPLHVSNRFALLSEPSTEKPVERALAIEDSVLTMCLLGARVLDIVGNLRVIFICVFAYLFA